MKKLLHEPLIHFLLAGASLFVVFAVVGNSAAPEDARIIVDASQIAQLQDAWSKQWHRFPTDRELQGLIESFIQEEVLYREALAMGLEQDDTIIRRRLAQKVKFLVQDIADQNQPTDAELRAFYGENQAQFELPARISFTHVYFNPDHRGEAALADARQLLDDLKQPDAQMAADAGDPFMLQYEYVELSQPETGRLFGSAFAEELFTHRPGPWQGPLSSGYGVHLARVTAYVPARQPEFAEVADDVRQEYMAAQRRKANEAAVAELKARYEIVIDDEVVRQGGSQAVSVAPPENGS